MVNITKAKTRSRYQKIKEGRATKKTPPIKFNSNIEYVCDFETLTANTQAFKEVNDTKIILWAVRRRDAIDNGETIEYKEYEIKYNKYNKKPIRQEEYNDYKGFIVGTSGESFIDFVLNQPKSATFYFHNLKYDATYIIPLLSKNEDLTQVHYEGNPLSGIELIGYEASRNNAPQLKANHWDLFRDGKKVFYIALRKKGKQSYINLKFRCSYLMLSSSIKALGEAMTNEKFNGKTLKKFLQEEGCNEDFYNVEPVEKVEQLPKEFFEYCLRDVEIARRAINNFHDLINKELPSINRYNDERREHNEKMGEGTRHQKYKEGGELDIWGMSVSIAGLMRKLMHMIYIPYFQYSNPKFREDVKYRHLGNATYGNFAKSDIDTHNFFTEEHDLFLNGNGGKIFRGGLTQFNPKFQSIEELQDCGDCGKWDISSAYPYQMTKPLPFGKLINRADFVKYYSDLKEGEFYEFLVIPVKKAIAKENALNCATLPNFTAIKDANNNKLRYVLEQENFTLSILKEEWEELQHWYTFIIDETISVERYYMLSAPFLKSMSEELYERKDYFSEQKLGAYKQGVKIAINSVYGSLGIRAAFDTLIYVNKDIIEDIMKQEVISMTGKKDVVEAEVKVHSEHIDTNYAALRVREDKDIKDVWNIAAAATITALERVYVMQTIREVGAEYFAYGDTDSVVLGNLTPKARARMEAIEERRKHPTLNIGRWECEYRKINGFAAHKAKEYIQIVEGKNEPIIKNAGFVLPKGESKIKDLFCMTLPQREKLTIEEIKEFYEERKELVNEDFCGRIRKGDTLILYGNVYTKSYPSGDIIVKEDKWTAYGAI